MRSTTPGNEAPTGEARLARKSLVPAVTRAARLLDVLAASAEPMRLGDLVEALQLPKSTVHGLCGALVDAGLVAREDDATYRLGVRIMDLAHAYLSGADVTAEFLQIVQSEAPLPEESIVLAVLDGADIVYVACRNGSRPFGFNFRIGMRLPANCASSGKALLSTLPNERIEALWRSAPFQKLTENSISELEPFLAQLEQTRMSGVAIDDEETRLGMVCIGAPVFGPSSREAVAAVAISVSKSGLDAKRRDLIADTVTGAAASISRRLGARMVTARP